jgi:hypothetical protein
VEDTEDDAELVPVLDTLLVTVVLALEVAELLTLVVADEVALLD